MKQLQRHGLLLVLALDAFSVAPCLAQTPPEPAQSAPVQLGPVPEVDEPDLIHDSQDGAFDISDFLSSRTGFLPLVMPITEPAVGYGVAGALAFFHEKPRVLQTPDGPRVVPPNLTAVGGMATEN